MPVAKRSLPIMKKQDTYDCGAWTVGRPMARAMGTRRRGSTGSTVGVYVGVDRPRCGCGRAHQPASTRAGHTWYVESRHKILTPDTSTAAARRWSCTCAQRCVGPPARSRHPQTAQIRPDRVRGQHVARPSPRPTRRRDLRRDRRS